MAESPPNVDEAIAFFNECILQPHQAKERHYRESGVWGAGSASDADWVAFAALLTGDRPGGDSDLPELSRHHVRNHRFGSGPLYTFVQEAVEDEFEAFKERYHLAFSYADNLSHVELRRFTGAQWVEYVEQYGGITFFAFSGFTDPEIDIRPSWLYEHAELMLVLDSGRLSYLNPSLTSN